MVEVTIGNVVIAIHRFLFYHYSHDFFNTRIPKWPLNWPDTAVVWDQDIADLLHRWHYTGKLIHRRGWPNDCELIELYHLAMSWDNLALRRAIINALADCENSHHPYPPVHAVKFAYIQMPIVNDLHLFIVELYALFCRNFSEEEVLALGDCPPLFLVAVIGCLGKRSVLGPPTMPPYSGSGPRYRIYPCGYHEHPHRDEMIQSKPCLPVVGRICC